MTSLAKSIETLTGFTRFVVVQSGSAALALILEIASSRDERVAIPGLACWTVFGTAVRHGLRPRVVDVDPDFGWLPTDDCRLSIDVDPWGFPGPWDAPVAGTRILDLTQSIGATVGDLLPAHYYKMAYFSTGLGKPVDAGGGGVALFQDKEMALEARKLLKYGVQKGEWARLCGRYMSNAIIVDWVDRRLRQSVERLERDREFNLSSRAVLRSLPGPLGTNSLRSGAQPGLRADVPLTVPDAYPLSAEEIEAPCLLASHGLRRHPLGRLSRQTACPNLDLTRARRSEDISARLLFAHWKGDSEGLAAFLESLFSQFRSHPERFKRPYIWASDSRRERVLAALDEGCWRVCRGFDGNLYAVDEVLERAMLVEQAAADTRMSSLERARDD